jgi:hypothetical protein
MSLEKKMTKAVKINGFNDKEQRIYEMFAKTPNESCSIGELAELFLKEAKKDNNKAQSFVRNSLRRLVRDGWVVKISYGTYRLTTDGRRWVKMGKTETSSFNSKKGRPTKKAAKKKAAKKKTTKKKTTKKKTKAKKKKTNNTPSVQFHEGANESKPVKAPPKLRRAKNREALRDVGPESAKARAQELAQQIALEGDQAC